MIQFDLPKEQSSIIKVIGVGGGGSNAVNYMHSLDIDGVDFMVCNTDAQALSQSKVPNKIQLGPSLTQGLGAGANPEIGRQATEESLDEIRRILEVNTKMAFVTAGMGGGTGTGGAPIIAKICRDMGILTVGIITTPFSYEGKKRALHAEAGIQQMKSVVDTLLVISNDKLRHQFGNLTMSAALSTADNVLATAAKCITDVINTKGQINVDFADVCTVMRNGGVAILGSARASGEHRAQLVIEQALNSPLLNDNDISGAKWVLININSRSGESEFTMDEVETIQEYLLTQAGPEADIILGLGYDESLGDDISITIIATGFEGKSALGNSPAEKQQEKKDEKVMFMLDVNPQPVKKVELVESSAGTRDEGQGTGEQPGASDTADLSFHASHSQPVIPPSTICHSERSEESVMQQGTSDEGQVTSEQPIIMMVEEKVERVEKVEEVEVVDEQPIVFELDLDIKEVESPSMLLAEINSTNQQINELTTQQLNNSTTKPLATPASFLTKPIQIYAMDAPAQQPAAAMPAIEPVAEVKPIQQATPQPVEQPTPEPVAQIVPQVEEKEPEPSFELVYHETVETPVQVAQEQTMPEPIMEEPVAFDEAEAQKNKAAERLYKLRNLSYNFNAADPNNEYENIPAYVRHNLQVHNTTLASVEKFYSNYSVGLDENNITQINTINTFLEGKKPD